MPCICVCRSFADLNIMPVAFTIVAPTLIIAWSILQIPRSTWSKCESIVLRCSSTRSKCESIVLNPAPNRSSILESPLSSWSKRLPAFSKSLSMTSK